MILSDFCCMKNGICQSYPALAEAIEPFEWHQNENKRALLLLHGFSSTPAVFRALRPLLSFYDVLIGPTLPGHGEDLTAFSKTRAHDWLTWVEELGLRLQQRYSCLDVLGLSLGGLLAYYLEQKISINHLFLLAPAFDLTLPIKTLKPVLKSLQGLGFEQVKNLAGDIHHSPYCEITYRALPLKVIYELFHLIETLPQHTLRCSTDIFLGVHDKIVDNKRVAARFHDTSEVTLHWLAHSAHILPLDGDIEYMSEIIRSRCNR